MNGMSKETLKSYLSNTPLIQAISQKKSVNDTRKKLIDALHILGEVGLNNAAIEEVQKKQDEYLKISRGYDELISTVWGISWQAESFIAKYIDYDDVDIDRLPDYIKFG